MSAERMIGRGYRQAVCMAGLALALCSGTAAADEPVANNADFLLGIVQQELRGTLGRLGINESARFTMDTLRLTSVKPTPHDWLLEYALVEVLGKKQMQIVRGAGVPAVKATPETTGTASVALVDSAVADSLPDTAQIVAASPVVPALPNTTGLAGKTFRLEYRITEAYVQYRRIWREGFVGVKKIERYGRLEVYLQLIEAASGAVVWQGRPLAAGTDVVLFAAKPFMESADYAVLKSETIKPYWKEAAETALAGGSVGYLLYLFFSKSFN